MWRATDATQSGTDASDGIGPPAATVLPASITGLGDGALISPSLRHFASVRPQELAPENGLVRRHAIDNDVDGLPPGDGCFLPCSFWLVDNLVLMAARERAVSFFLVCSICAAMSGYLPNTIPNGGYPQIP